MSRRATIAIAIVVLWVVGLGLLARRQLGQTDADRLSEAALRVSPAGLFYGVYQNQHHIGWASSTLDTTVTGISLIDFVVADLPFGGRSHRTSLRVDVNTNRALKLVDFSMALEQGAGPIRATGRAVGDSALLLMVATGGDMVDTQQIATGGGMLVHTIAPIVMALGERPEIGATYSLPVFDPLSLAPSTMEIEITAESLMVVSDSARMDPRTRRWTSAHSDTVRAWRIAVAGAGGFNGWIDDQGRMVEGAYAQLPGLVIRRMAYEEAFDNWRLEGRAGTAVIGVDRDILETTAIGADANLDRRALSRLSVKLGNVSLDGFDLDGGRQQLRGDTLTITREADSQLAADYVLPLGGRDKVRGGLSAEPLVQVMHPEIRKLANTIIRGTTDPVVAARRINDWVHDSLRKRLTFGIPSALQVLRTRAGDCNEHTQLFMALARAVGIPTRSAAGLAWIDGKFYYHAWPEVYLTSWVAIDPTFGQFPADAAHLRFINGGLARQTELLRLMNTLDIAVLSRR